MVKMIKNENNREYLRKFERGGGGCLELQRGQVRKGKNDEKDIEKIGFMGRIRNTILILLNNNAVYRYVE